MENFKSFGNNTDMEVEAFEGVVVFNIKDMGSINLHALEKWQVEKLITFLQEAIK